MTKAAAAAPPAPAPASNPGQNGKRGRDRERTPSTTKIEDLLKEGQEVVVQVLKEPSARRARASPRTFRCRDGSSSTCRPSITLAYRERSIQGRTPSARHRPEIQGRDRLPGGVIIRTAAVNRPGGHPQRSPVFPDRLDRSAATQGDTAACRWCSIAKRASSQSCCAIS